LTALIDDRLFKLVVNQIEPNKLTETAQDLICIRSENPPGSYREIANYLSKKWTNIGLKTRLIEVSHNKLKEFKLETPRINLVGTIGTGKESALILDGHTDTVPVGEGWSVDPLKGILKDSRIYGRGASDMKGGLAVMTSVAEALIHSDVELKENLILTATVDDEIAGSLGMKYLLENHLVKGRCAVCCEGTSSSENEVDINSCFGGRLWLRVTTKGKSAHGAKPSEGINAIEKMFHLYQELQKIRLPHHKVYGPSTMNLGTISGGTRPNIVPDSCSATLDIRFGPSTSTQEVMTKLKETATSISQYDSEFTINDVEVIESREAFEIPADTKLVTSLAKAIRMVTGTPTKLTHAIGSGNAYHLWQTGIPAVFCGPGNPANFHTANEFVSLQSLLNCTKILSHLALQLCARTNEI